MMPFWVSAEEPEFHFISETTLAGFERENDQGDSQQVIPIYEYMQMDYSSDPSFDENVRLTVVLKYVY